jgi:Cytochrome c554 and c-prime
MHWLSARLASVLGVCGCAALCAQSGTYIGSGACGRCHPAEFRQQSASGHARALYSAAQHPLAPAFLPKTVLERKPRYRFQFSYPDKVLRVNVFDSENVMDIPIEWAFGAGEQAVTFVSRIDPNWYLEHYFTYYPAIGRMGVTPGQQALEPKSLPEAAGLVYKALDPEEGILRCFQCHSTGQVVTSGGVIRPGETGVHCESCHGPGSAHARKPDRKLIQNPKRKSAAELNDFCGVCHRPPAANGTLIDWNYSWNVRHQPVYLSQSACFRKSNGSLSCLSCHQPHEALRRDSGSYNAVCASCHNAAHRDSAMSNCIDCHMPRVSPQPPLRFTNHWIGVYREGAKLKPLRSSNVN